MPPANTPDDEPSQPQLLAPSQQHRSLTPLSYLSSPAPDLASTLQSRPPPSAADEANTDFLRSSLHALERTASNLYSTHPPRHRAYVDPDRDPRLLSHADETLAAAAEDPTRRQRLQRVLSRLNRLNSSAPASSNGAYGNRTPPLHQGQNLYDWAPADTENAIEQELALQSDVDVILRELRAQAPETSDATMTYLSRTLSRDLPEPTAGFEGYEARSERRRRERERARTVRGMAVLQRARREGSGSGRTSPSATDRLLRYVIERERSGMSEEEERARGSGWFAQPGSGEGRMSGTGLLASRANEIRERDHSEGIEAFRRGYLAEHVPTRLPRIATSNNAGPPTGPSPLLENAIKYLYDLRSCVSYEDSLAAAINNDFATKEFFADKHDDLITNLDQIAQDFPEQSSWLQPGATFEGHQHASSASVTTTHHQLPAHNPRMIEQINPHYHSLNSDLHQSQHAPFDPSRPWLSHTIPQAPTNLTVKTVPSSPSTEHWPVYVTIHDIDWTTKTLSGTMRAYDVPQHPANFSSHATPPKDGHKKAPITTYLEGHILDLATHTFVTPAPQKAHATLPENATPYTTTSTSPTFPSATPALDARNWLALPPFSEHLNSSGVDQATNMAHMLLSPTSLRALNSEYIFMRWKERCFIHSRDEYSSCSAPESERSTDKDRGHGLTIGGFYYISLRRGDGKVEGLYFDPGSTPYQLLRLGGVVGGWGSCEFR